MDCIATRLPYRQTNAFNKIILDYIDQSDALKPFYAHPATVDGLKKAIEARKKFSTNRDVLVQQLQLQYKEVNVSAATEKNLAALAAPTTFTITTAHQPNLFTGPLYFLYKILHTIRLADTCKTLFEEYDFVPVYYMGSEDADLDELGHFYIDGEKRTWQTGQTGAVGRMKVDKSLRALIDAVEGQLSVLPHGNEIVALVKKFYTEGTTIASATFQLVNHLFADYGLVILLPDNAALKKQMTAVFKDDLLAQSASAIVETSAAALNKAGYKVQANPREVNLFYLKDDKRERIERINDRYTILNTSVTFSQDALLQELNDHPERFSPNVILRGLYQETILPNIIFIGGGGETAYWLQLKGLFEHYQVPFPVLVLRNSFLIIEPRVLERTSKLGFLPEDLFSPGLELVNQLVKRNSDKKLQLNGTLSATEKLYAAMKEQAAAVDSTLGKHVDALKEATLHKLRELEKKMLRAEKRKFTDQERQLRQLKETLFPKNSLQERIDNFMPWYAKYGASFIEQLYQHSLALDHEFVILSVK